LQLILSQLLNSLQTILQAMVLCLYSDQWSTIDVRFNTRRADVRAERACKRREVGKAEAVRLPGMWEAVFAAREPRDSPANSSRRQTVRVHDMQ